MNTFFQRPDKIKEPLYVVTPIFNPARYRVRWKLYEDFALRVKHAGGILYTGEVAFGERKFVVTKPNNPRHLQLYTAHELWLKENVDNLIVQRLPPDWKYVACVDADVAFARDDWADETLHALQHYDVVQMWSQYQDLSPDNEVLGTAHSFMWNYLNHREQMFPDDKCSPYYGYSRPGYPGAPGLAWAYTRKAWDTFGGLLDTAILGACDWYMAHAIVGQTKRVMRRPYSQAFKDTVYKWERDAEPLRKNVGVVKGMALHYFHGPKKYRKYATRDQILINAGYDPRLDLKRDWQGLYQLTDRSIELRDGIRRYFAERNEDAI